MKRSPWMASLIPPLCLIGAAIAIHLTVLHYRLLFGSVGGDACGVNGDCAAVVGSRYGQWLGVPVALWGLWYYVVAALLSLTIVRLGSERGAPYLRALGWLATLAVIADVALAWIAWTRLGRFCPWCVATYAVNAAILAIAVALAGHQRLPWLGPLPRFASDPAREPDRQLRTNVAALAGLALVVVAATLAAALWLGSKAHALERENRAGLLAYLAATGATPLPEAPLESRGPRDAPIRLVMFSDFLCERCAVLSRYLDIVAANHRDSIRIEFRNYPMDLACNPRAPSNPHPGACELARAGECAARQGRFWQFHRAALAGGGISDPGKIEAYAAAAGLDLAAFRACRNDPASLAAVRADLALADSLEITSTPTTFINGRAVVGAFKPWLWEDMVRAVAGR